MLVTARIQKRHHLTVAKLTAAKGPQQPVVRWRFGKVVFASFMQSGSSVASSLAILFLLAEHL